jgi:hypothetical protein
VKKWAWRADLYALLKIMGSLEKVGVVAWHGKGSGLW